MGVEELRRESGGGLLAHAPLASGSSSASALHHVLTRQDSMQRCVECVQGCVVRGRARTCMCVSASHARLAARYDVRLRVVCRLSVCCARRVVVCCGQRANLAGLVSS